MGSCFIPLSFRLCFCPKTCSTSSVLYKLTKISCVRFLWTTETLKAFFLPGSGELTGLSASLRAAGPVWAGASAVRPLRPSGGGGGGLLRPAGPAQRQTGGRVLQPPEAPGRPGDGPDGGWAGQAGRTCRDPLQPSGPHRAAAAQTWSAASSCGFLWGINLVI